VAVRTRGSVTAPDGVALAVTSSGAGPPVLLVHGSAVTGASWAHVARALAPDHTVHVLDRRGRAGSGDRPPDYRLALEVDDLRAVVAALSVTGAPPHLVGHSYGGLIAARAAARLGPGQLAGLTLYEPTVLPATEDGWSQQQLARSRSLLARGDPAGATALFLGEVIGLSDAELAGLRSVPAAWLATVELAAVTLREGAAARRAAGHLGMLAAVAAPTQVLVGANSPRRFQVAARAAAAAIPGARLSVLAGQAHLAMTSAPRLLAEEIASWPPPESSSAGSLRR
jgi:pimeloyl-ACP methyl ester carboxylesterase